MIGRWRIEGHAIVSEDDRIAGADGLTPPSLYDDTDWTRFQAALDRAAVTVLGRLGQLANRNLRGRNRLVMSSEAKGIERRSDAWWWNPAEVPLADALAEAAPAGGTVAVPGGRRVFDYFLAAGYDQFDLARKSAITIPDGIPIFTEVDYGKSAESLLAAAGLRPGPTEVLDRIAGVTLTAWRRP